MAAARSRGAEPSWWDRALARPAYAAIVVVVAALEVVRIATQHLTKLNLLQQYVLVSKLASGHLHGAMGEPIGTSGQLQASPPGYGFFALPFHLLIHPFTHSIAGYEAAGWASLLLLGVAAASLGRALGIPAGSPRELLTITAVTGTSAVTACMTESYHPCDILAAALLLFALRAVLGQQWGWAAVLLGAGILSKQWVLPAMAVLATLYPGRPRRVMVAGSLSVAAVGILPFFLTDPTRTYHAWTAPLVTPAPRSWLFHLTVSLPNGVLSLEARLLPLLLVAGLCAWIEGRSTTPTAGFVVAAVAVAMLCRPVLDPAGFAYYLAPGMVLLAFLPRRLAPVAVLLIGWLVSSLATVALSNHREGRHLAADALSAGLAKGLIEAGLLLFAILELRRAVTRPLPQHQAPTG